MKKKGRRRTSLTRKSLLSLILIVVILTGLSCLAYTQITSHMNLGLDLVGGVYVLLEAREAEGKVEQDTIERAITIIRNRVDEFGVSEPLIQQEGENRIRVELPDIDDPARAMEVIGRTALLTFVDPEGEIVVTGANLTKAEYTYDEYNHPAVGLEFDREGSEKFAEATGKWLEHPIAIILDDELVSAPVVNSVVNDGKAIIQGQFTAEEARDLALILRSGALPVELVELETRTIGPTLGLDSRDSSLKAGIIGMILLVLFMIVIYRVMGVLASYALGIYVVLVLAVLTVLNATLTLPGIAGLILSIGMAVDANVIIFERFKEEYESGKTLKSAVEAGFKNALSTILDSNITTLIAGVVLFYFGTGPVKGFAVTLSVGILISMFTAIVLTRYLLRFLIGANIITNPRLFGVRGLDYEQISSN